MTVTSAKARKRVAAAHDPWKPCELTPSVTMAPASDAGVLRSVCPEVLRYRTRDDGDVVQARRT
jgi:hypothetical protein